MKKLIPAYILSFVMCFMLFLYEPIIMYANNVNDFWFDIYTMFVPTILIFLGIFFVISVFYTIVYLINNKASKKLYVYNVILIMSYIAFLALYIQGNFLAGNLPALDGSKVDWSGHTGDTIVSCVLWIIVTVAICFCVFKFKFEKTIKYSKYVVIAVFAMLLVSFITTLFTTDAFVKKEGNLTFTRKNQNVASSNKNFFIFMIDAVDSKIFNEVLENSEEYKDILKDFTYFPDTMSGYPFTRDSIPFILSGEWNNNEKDFVSYSEDVMKDAKFLTKLDELDYDINLYEAELIMKQSDNFNISNAVISKGILLHKYVKEEVRYALFRYLPYPLKKYSKIEHMSFNSTKKTENEFECDNISNYINFVDNKLEVKEKNYFQFIHLEGGHVAFTYDKDFKEKENATYQDKLGATLNMLDKFITRLKKNNVYDNSVIIVMSDHGYNFESYIGRQNPCFYIKGINETHEKAIESDASVSYEDLNSAYFDLLEGKKSTELFKSLDKNRERRYLLYEYNKEEHMVEYMQKDKAWETNKMRKTGNVFDR